MNKPAMSNPWAACGPV